ncbi:MAG: MBOAT family protein [Oscillospiraceae bacterium]|nr:MBOAT family protein [Oscillospiraceae bacterium]
MVFSSLLFLYIFFPLCMLLYFLRGSIQWRNGVLIVMSLLFYAWGEPLYILLILATALLNHHLAIQIEQSGKNKKKRRLAFLAVALNLGFLGFFKYTGFFVETLNLIPWIKLPVPDIAMPIGISFYTFQILSYVIDVYRGQGRAQRDFMRTLLFLTLFHQLMAGPIIRYEHVAAELAERRTSARQVWAGIERFAAGLAKKALLANTCGELADQLLNPEAFGSLSVLGAWLGILLFALQIYFDFSAYSDMAIAMGKMVGLHYHENFDYPYLSGSVTEFWRRWHMSLGSFFRDYVYIPLGGNRRHPLRNLLLVWALTGLWHGASWNFVVWGLYYFVFIAFEKHVLARLKRKPPAALMHIYTLLAVVFGWVLFYYTNIAEAFGLFGKLFGITAVSAVTPEAALTLQNNVFFLILALIACLPVTKLLRLLEYRLSMRGKWESRGVFALKYALVLLLLLLSTAQLAGNSFNPFIYFRF